jgi:hypothetical protein
MIKIYNRLKKLEQRLSPPDDRTFTLEELCRAMWREDKGKFLAIAKYTSLSLFARQFEIDDLGRAAADRQMRRRK